MSESSSDGGSVTHQNGSGESDSGAFSGQAGGQESVADSFATERDALTRQAREWQGRHDRAQAQLAELQSQLAKGAESDNTGINPAYMTVDDFRSEMARLREMDGVQTELRQKFPNADPEIFDLADEFDSIEDFALVVEYAHRESEQARATMRSEVEAEVRAEYEKQFGRLRTAPGSSESGPPAGGLNFEDAATMPLRDYLALKKEERAALLRSTTPE